MSKKVYPSPMTATFKQLCDLPRDNKSWGDYCLMTDAGTVWLSQQKMGEQPTQEFELPRHIFNRLIKWYAGMEK